MCSRLRSQRILHCRKISGETIETQASDNDDDESINSASALDLVKNRNFELLPNDHNFLPDWIDDNDLKNSPTETLGSQEEEFWVDLISKYLEPIEPTDAEKVRKGSII